MNKLLNKIPAWLVTAIAFGVTGGFVGATLLAIFEVASFGQSEWDFLGALFGGAIGAGVAIALWLLTYLHEQKKESLKRIELRKALWTEVSGMLRLLVVEKDWWENQIKTRNPLTAQKRFYPHFKLAVLEANLARISDLDAPTTDALIELRNRILPVVAAMEENYDFIDRFFSGLLPDLNPNAPPVNLTKAQVIAQASKIARDQKDLVLDGLFKAAQTAKRARNRLDSDCSFNLSRKAFFSEQGWIEDQKWWDKTYRELE